MNAISYYSESYTANCAKARRLEFESKWEEARELHKALGHTQDVAAIDLIIESTRKGDRFRELTKGLNQLHEDRAINNAQLHEELSKAWKQVYDN